MPKNIAKHHIGTGSANDNKNTGNASPRINVSAPYPVKSVNQSMLGPEQGAVPKSTTQPHPNRRAANNQP